MHEYNNIITDNDPIFIISYYYHHLIRCALQLRGRRNWQITTAAATPNDVSHTTTAICYILLLYYVCVCVCVCMCAAQHLPRTNYFYLTSVLYIFFFLLRDLLCPLSFHRLVKFSMSDKDMYYYYYYVYRSYRPGRIRTLFFISIIDSSLQHDGSTPVILFFLLF